MIVGKMENAVCFKICTATLKRPKYVFPAIPPLSPSEMQNALLARVWLSPLESRRSPHRIEGYLQDKTSATREKVEKK